MAITPLPPAPSRSNPAAFADVGDIFLAALPVFAEEANTLAVSLEGAVSSATASASNATAQAATATTKAGEAAASASNALSSKSAAVAAANAAAAAYDSFDDRYLGAKAADPATDNDGNALAVGALYFNTASGTMRVWNGSVWSASYLPASGYQETLVSGTNIKTIGGRSPLGSGDLPVGKIYEFTSSGTFAKPANASVILIELWGGGGGGANAIGTSSAFCCGAYGGEYAAQIYDAAEVGTTETITFGVGGAGAANGTNSTGESGGGSSAGSLLTARGGLGGRYSTSLTGGAWVGFPGSGNYQLVDLANDNLWKFLSGSPSANRGMGGFGLVLAAMNKGGDTYTGGGGGGGACNLNVPGAGGLSRRGGNGGAANITANTKGENGFFPAGGGGASTNDGGGGDGADGFCRITVW